MSLPRLPAELVQRGGDPELVAREYLWLIEQAIANAPRSHQAMIGPSEIGTECARAIGYKLINAPKRTRPPNWRATVGTSVHMYLEQVFGGTELGDIELVSAGNERWAVETVVTVGELDGIPILGKCDVYDRTTATVIDHKTCGPSRLAKIKRAGEPPRKYRVQIHLYGLGWERAGLPVDTVMISFLPRDGDLADAYVWHEPYNRDLALEALARLEGIATIARTLGPGALPTTDDYCYGCPYWRPNPTDLDLACPGDPGMYVPPAPITMKGK